MYSASIIGSVTSFMKIMVHLLVFALGLGLFYLWTLCDEDEYMWYGWQWACTIQEKIFPDGNCYYLFQWREGWEVGVFKDLKRLSLGRMKTSCSFSPQGTRENGIKLVWGIWDRNKTEFPNCVGSQTLKCILKEVCGHQFYFDALKKMERDIFYYVILCGQRRVDRWFTAPGSSWSMSRI